MIRIDDYFIACFAWNLFSANAFLGNTCLTRMVNLCLVNQSYIANYVRLLQLACELVANLYSCNNFFYQWKVLEKLSSTSIAN